MSNNLYAAHRAWATRPADECFWTLDDMLKATKSYKDSAIERVLPTNTLRLQTSSKDDNEVELVGSANNPAKLTHWSFGQLAKYVGAPAEYLRGLPAHLAATNINHGLSSQNGNTNLMFHTNGSLVMRSITTDKYGRIWDATVVEKAKQLQEYGWRTPPARPSSNAGGNTRLATEKDVLQVSHPTLSVKVGDVIAPTGLYASAHDCFIFMVNEENRVKDGSDEGLSRGFFLSNSEVGNGQALKLTTFFYRHVCSNLIVWSASKTKEIRIVHKGSATRRFQHQYMAELRNYSENSALYEEQCIRKSQSFVIGNNKEEIIEILFKNLRGDIGKKHLENGYDRAVMDSNYDKTINPQTLWGVSNGISAYSQSIPYMDERMKLDRAAGKILALAV